MWYLIEDIIFSVLSLCAFKSLIRSSGLKALQLQTSSSIASVRLCLFLLLLNCSYHYRHSPYPQGLVLRPCQLFAKDFQSKTVTAHYPSIEVHGCLDFNPSILFTFLNQYLSLSCPSDDHISIRHTKVCGHGLLPSCLTSLRQHLFPINATK